MFGDRPTLRDFLNTLERAGDDKRVKGHYAQLGEDAMAAATGQEIRDAIRAFRAKGKFALAFYREFRRVRPRHAALLSRHRL